MDKSFSAFSRGTRQCVGINYVFACGTISLGLTSFDERD
jgi:hypothetical protein